MFLTKKSWRRLEDVFWRRRRKTFSRRLQDVFMTSSSRRMFAGFLLKCHYSKGPFKNSLCSGFVVLFYFFFFTVYVLILEQLLAQKNTVSFCFCGLSQTPTFQIIYKHPLSRSILFLRLDIPLYKIFTNAIQNITWDVADFWIKQFVFLLWFSFQRSFFICFNALCSFQLIIYWNKNNVSKKINFRNLCIC